MTIHGHIIYPPNVKEAQAVAASVYGLIVVCPFCGKNHPHKKIERFLIYVAAPCGKGNYRIKVTT